MLIINIFVLNYLESQSDFVLSFYCFSLFLFFGILIYFKQFDFSVGARKKVHFSSIHDAVRAGDVKQLSEMVERGVSINEVDVLHKFTPLHWAAHSGSLEVS